MITLQDKSSESKKKLVEKNMSYYELHGFFPCNQNTVHDINFNLVPAEEFVEYNINVIKNHKKITLDFSDEKMIYDNVRVHCHLNNIKNNYPDLYKYFYIFHDVKFDERLDLKIKLMQRHVEKYIKEKRQHKYDDFIKECGKSGAFYSRIRIFKKYLGPVYTYNEVVKKYSDKMDEDDGDYPHNLVTELKKYKTYEGKMVDEKIFFLQKSLLTSMIKFIKYDDDIKHKYIKYKNKYHAAKALLNY